MKIQVCNLDYSFNDKMVLKDISFTLEKNQCLVIQGHNGGGKTTLINCLVQKNSVKKNKIFYDDIDINKFNNWRKIGFVPQFVNYSGFPVSVLEFLTAFDSTNNKKHVLELLENFAILELKNKNIHTLSGGQRRRVFIVRALLNNPEVLIFDEPLVAIDVENREKIISILKNLKKSVSMIIITHNFHEFHGLADKIMELNREVQFYGTEEEYLKHFGVCTHGAC